MTTISDIPSPDADVWATTTALLEDELGICPWKSVDGVRFCGIGTGNVGVHVTATEVQLVITHTDRPDSPAGVPAKPVAEWELSMPPAFARYLASLLDAHARYVLSAPAIGRAGE